MRNPRLLFALIGAGALAISPVGVRASNHCVGPISWGTTYSYESDYGGNVSDPNSVLSIVGLVDCFTGAFADIDPAAKEYSFYFANLISDGTAVTPGVGPGGAWTAYQTHYTGGSFAIYEDDTPDAVFTANPPNVDVPGKFQNAGLFLSGELNGLTVTFFLETATGAYKGGNFDTGAIPSGARFTGGSHFGRVSVNGEGCPLRATGGWNVTPAAHPAGYTADVAGKIDIDCPVPAFDSTWGRMKALYR